MNIYQSNTYRKDVSWLHFNDKPKVQDRQQVKDQQSCISVFLAYLRLLLVESLVIVILNVIFLIRYAVIINYFGKNFFQLRENIG